MMLVKMPAATMAAAAAAVISFVIAVSLSEVPPRSYAEHDPNDLYTRRGRGGIHPSSEGQQQKISGLLMLLPLLLLVLVLMMPLVLLLVTTVVLDVETEHVILVRKVDQVTGRRSEGQQMLSM